MLALNIAREYYLKKKNALWEYKIILYGGGQGEETSSSM